MSVAQGVLFIPIVILGNLWFGLTGIIWALTVTEGIVFAVGLVMWLASVVRSTEAWPKGARSARKRCSNSRRSEPAPTCDAAPSDGRRMTTACTSVGHGAP